MIYLEHFKRNTGLVLLFSFLWCSIGFGQKGEGFVVEEHQEYTLQDNLEVGQLIIKGVFKVEDKKDISLKFSSLLIDGGTLIVGSKDHPFQHQLTLQITSNEGYVKVLNGGSLGLFGMVQTQVKLERIQPGSAFKTADDQRNIEWNTNKKSSGHILLSNAGNINIWGTSFNGLGTPMQPALTIQGQTKEKPFLSNCVFQASKNIDLRINDSSVVIQDNLFISKAHTSIKSHYSHTAQQPIFKNNIVYNASGPDNFAVVLESLAHIFTDNDVVVDGNTHGVGILNKQIKGKASTKTDQKFIFNNNRMVNITAERQKTNIGLRVDNFGSKNLIPSSGNKIEGFGIGAVLKNPKFVGSNYVFTDNSTGCIPGPSYLLHAVFRLSDQTKKEHTRGIWVTDLYGKSAPKLSDVKIQNYGLGIHFEGFVSSANYFTKINFERTNAISFSNIAVTSVIHDKDGSLIWEKNEKTQAMKIGIEEPHGHHGHHGHHGKMEVTSPKGHILFPKSSFFSNTKSKQVPNFENIHFSPRSNIGILTIATGMGLTDPVHEHKGEFNGLTVLNSAGISSQIGTKSNKYELEVIADALYELDFDEQPLPYFDFGFEWEAQSQKSILIKLPYKHNHPVAMRSFGNQLYGLQDMNALKNSKESAFFWDEANKSIYLKMVAQNNFEEMVIYSSDIQTEITLGGIKVPLSLKTNTSTNQICFEYTVPNKNSYSKLEILDYYGQVVERPFEGYPDEFTNKVFIDLKNYDFERRVYRYALTVDNEVHRGPIYIY